MERLPSQTPKQSRFSRLAPAAGRWVLISGAPQDCKVSKEAPRARAWAGGGDRAARCREAGTSTRGDTCAPRVHASWVPTAELPGGCFGHFQVSGDDSQSVALAGH